MEQRYEGVRQAARLKQVLSAANVWAFVKVSYVTNLLGVTEHSSVDLRDGVKELCVVKERLNSIVGWA